MTRSHPSSPKPFALSVSGPRSEVVVLSISGEFDSTVIGQVRDCVDQLRPSDHAHLVIDLTGVRFMDSSGVAVLIAAHNPRDGVDEGTVAPALHLVGATDNRAVSRVLQIVGLDSFFSTFADLDECLTQL